MNVLNQLIDSAQRWAMYQGDCVETLRGIPDNSIHYSIFSPPFASLYTYSNSDRDMGNSSDGAEFVQHFGYLVAELYRVIMPGRLVSIHCMNLPAMKSRDGFIGIKDFRGDIIREMTEYGFIFHSEVCIWKNPVTEMQRTKALGLLHKQIRKDSAMSRQGLPDYVVTFRKPGENPEPIPTTMILSRWTFGRNMPRPSGWMCDSPTPCNARVPAMKRTKNTSALCNWTLSSGASTCGRIPETSCLTRSRASALCPIRPSLWAVVGWASNLKTATTRRP